MTDAMDITPGAGLELTREQIKLVEEFMLRTGLARLRNHRRGFSEVDFVFGVSTAIQALTTGGLDKVPPGWLFSLMAGRSVVDPEGEVSKSLGLVDCRYCGKPAEGNRLLGVDGDRICRECWEEERDDGR